MGNDEVYLKHMLDAIGCIEAYTRAMNRKQFGENGMTQDAVVRQLEIIGQATKNVSRKFKSDHPEIPWRKITGMRDNLIHEYFGVDLDIVWTTVNGDLPLLKKQLLEL